MDRTSKDIFSYSIHLSPLQKKMYMEYEEKLIRKQYLLFIFCPRVANVKTRRKIINKHNDFYQFFSLVI